MWLALVFVTLAAAGESASSSPGDYIKVEVCGTLRAGIMAIGGETTGVVINATGVTKSARTALNGAPSRWTAAGSS